MQLYLTILTADEETDNSLWRATKRIKRPIMQIPLIRKGQRDWARENKKEQIYSLNNNLEEIYNITKEEITPITPKEVAGEIKLNLNPKKVPGFDLITGHILKQLP